MEVLIREDGECLVFEEIPSMDAYEAREAQQDADRAKARMVAQQLRRRAEKLIAHAKRLEKLAAEGTPLETDQETLNPGEIFESLLYPTPDVIAIRDDQGWWHYLDLLTLADCNVDIEDPEILQEYIGSNADVTNRVQEEIARMDEAYHNYVQWLKERKLQTSATHSLQQPTQ